MSERGQLKRYLLGGLSPEERINVENRYLSGAAEFEELTEVENDLFDSYVRGALSIAESQEFQQRYLDCDRHRAKIGFARALTEISAERGQIALVEKPSLWNRLVSGDRLTGLIPKWALAAVATIAFAVTYTSFHWMNGRQMQARLQAPNVGTKGSEHSAGTSSPSPEQEGTVVTEVAKNDIPKLIDFTVGLDPDVSSESNTGKSRGLSSKASRNEKANSKVFIVPPGISRITLQMNLENLDFKNFIAHIETANGSNLKKITLRARLVHGKPAVLVHVPVRLIPSGNYVVQLDGVTQSALTEEGVEKYRFTIIRR